MIKVKGRIATFTGQDQKRLHSMSKYLGLSMQECFTGMLWETIMQKAREGLFRKQKKSNGR